MGNPQIPVDGLSCGEAVGRDAPQAGTRTQPSRLRTRSLPGWLRTLKTTMPAGRTGSDLVSACELRPLTLRTRGVGRLLDRGLVDISDWAQSSWRVVRANPDHHDTPAGGEYCLD